MSNGKWSPGPWRATKQGGTVRDARERTVAFLGPLSAAHSADPRAERVANARLIAAAPDLLEALQEMGDWLAYGLDKPDGAEPTVDDLRHCQEIAAKARKAVDKAKGEPE